MFMKTKRSFSYGLKMKRALGRFTNGGTIIILAILGIPCIHRNEWGPDGDCDHDS